MSYSSAYNQDSGYPSDTWARPPPPENQASSYNYSMGNQNSGSGEHSSQSWRAERHERSDRSYKTSSRDRDRSPSHHSKRSKSSRSPKRSSRHRSRSRDRYSRHSSRSRSRTRERSRRKRSRSRSRTWSKSRSRSPNTKHSRKRSRSPFMAKKRYSPVGPEPSYKIMLTSIPQHIDRDDLNIILAQQGYHPIDVRVIRKQVGGDTRVFGFIDFADVPTAKAWYEHNQGILRFEDGSHAKLDYSREPEHFRERQQQELNKPLTDWNCAKCTINNFNRRTNCFKCGTPRTESEAMEAKGYGMVGVAPCDTLLIRELPQGVDEGRIHASLAQYSNVPVQRIHIASSKMYALVQMRSIEDASYMLSTFNKVMPYIDNCAVIITFSRQSLNQVVIAECIARGQLPAVDPNSHVGKLQAAALQIAETSRSHQPMESTYIQSPMPSVQTISTPVGVFQIHSAPDPRNFQLEASSGYYYDSTTGFYFDSKTEYYYNSQVGQWMFWCQKYGAYIPVEGGNQELKKQMQEEEKLIKMSSSQIEISAPPQPASATVEVDDYKDQVLKALMEQNRLLMKALAEKMESDAIPEMPDTPKRSMADSPDRFYKKPRLDKPEFDEELYGLQKELDRDPYDRPPSPRGNSHHIPFESVRPAREPSRASSRDYSSHSPESNPFESPHKPYGGCADSFGPNEPYHETWGHNREIRSESQESWTHLNRAESWTRQENPRRSWKSERSSGSWTTSQTPNKWLENESDPLSRRAFEQSMDGILSSGPFVDHREVRGASFEGVHHGTVMPTQSWAKSSSDGGFGPDSYSSYERPPEAWRSNSQDWNMVGMPLHAHPYQPSHLPSVRYIEPRHPIQSSFTPFASQMGPLPPKPNQKAQGPYPKKPIEPKGCLNCLTPGHKIAECRTPIVCRNCGDFGHVTSKCMNPPADHAHVKEQLQEARLKVQQERNKLEDTIIMIKLNLTGDDMLSKQIKTIYGHSSPSVKKSELKFCMNCGEIGHQKSTCEATEQRYPIGKMMFLLRLYKKKAQLESLIEADVKSQAICTKCGKMGHKTMACKKPQPAPYQVDAIEKRVMKLQENLRMKKIKRDLAKIMLSVDLTGDDDFSQQLKELASDGNVTDSMLIYCRDCAKLGHRKCNQQTKNADDPLKMRFLINLYRQKMQPPSDAVPNLDDLDLKESWEDEDVEKAKTTLNEAQSSAPSTEKPKEDYLMPNKDFYNALKNTEKALELIRKNLTGSDPISLRIKQMFPDAKVNKAKLRVCTNCAGIGHQESECKKTKVPGENVKRMIFLSRLKSKELELIEKGDLPKEGVSKEDLDKVISEALEKIKQKGHKIPSNTTLCLKCGKFGHVIKDCLSKPVSTTAISNKLHHQVFMVVKLMAEILMREGLEGQDLKSLVAKEITSEDPVTRQLKELFPNGKVDEKQLKVCTICSKVGHVKRDCTSGAKASLEEVARVQFLVDLYKKMMASTDVDTKNGSKNDEFPEPQHQEVHQEPQQPPVEDKKEKKKKKEKDPNKPKTAQDIAKEMEKWAKRQEKVKMTFNKPEPKTPGNARYFDTSIAPAPRRDSIGEQAIEKTKATFMDDDDDEDVPNAPPPPEATVRIRGTVNLPLNKDPRRGTVPADQHQQITNDPTTAPTREAKDQPLFDEEQYVNREKIACLLCKRSFPKLETLEKHLKMSDLHKSNLEAKRKEFNLANPQPEQPESSVNYRDRADERRKKFGYDPTGLIEETPSGVPAGPIGPVGSIPVPVIQNPMALQQAAMIKAATPLDESNIGNKLLKSMGWSEGKGIVNPIQAQQRAPGVGLGSNVSVTNPSVLGGLYGHNRSSYLKAHTIQRWNELPDNQQ